MSHTYLLIPRLRVQSANAQATWWLINSAPVMACTLLGHALGRHLDEPVGGVAIVHHTAQLHGEQFRLFRPEQRRGAVFIDKKDYSSKNPHALSLQPTASFSGEFSLIVRFSEMADFELSAVYEFLARGRLAGGQIIEHRRLLLEHSETELRKRLRTGYWLIDRRDLMQKTDGEDWLDVLLRVTAWNREQNPSQQTSQPALPSSWIVPTTLGYALLTQAVKRAGAREGYPHAFAEPLVGPVQYVSFRDFGERPLPVWQHGWLRDDVFFLSQTDIEV